MELGIDFAQQLYLALLLRMKNTVLFVAAKPIHF